MSKQSNTNGFVTAVNGNLPLTSRPTNSQVDYELEKIIDNLKWRYNSKEAKKEEILAEGTAMTANKHGDIEGAPAYDDDKLLQLTRSYDWHNEQQQAVEFLLNYFLQAQQQLFPDAKEKAQANAQAMDRANKLFG